MTSTQLDADVRSTGVLGFFSKAKRAELILPTEGQEDEFNTECCGGRSFRAV